jgi:nitric oxide reductase NorD protein
MSEPEEVILDGAHAATEFVSSLWRRHAAPAPWLGLSDTRRRLELLIVAYGGQALPVVAAQAPARPTLFGRMARRTPNHLVDLRVLPSTDGVRIRLPPQLDAAHGTAAAARRYRLLALIQAARAFRGVPRLLEPDLDPLVHDLYLLGECAASDRELAAQLPGICIPRSDFTPTGQRLDSLHRFRGADSRGPFLHRALSARQSSRGHGAWLAFQSDVVGRPGE